MKNLTKSQETALFGPEDQEGKIVSKWTPGPWTLNNIGGYGKRGVFAPTFEDGKEPLATVRISGKYERGKLSRLSFEESDSNARLIAAAPELLEVCKYIEAAINFDTSGPIPITFTMIMSRRDTMALRVAIARAEGRS